MNSHYGRVSMSKESFETDLRKACEEASSFLRDKNNSWNLQKKNDKEKVFSKEHEFVAEVYRLMVSNDLSYRKSMRIDYMFPEPGQEKRQVAPDITYYESDCKVAVEVKVVVVKKSEGTPRLFEHDFHRIDGDYKEKLREQSYKQFNRKYLVVVFLGAYDNGFTQGEFKETISKKYPDTEDISVIVF